MSVDGGRAQASSLLLLLLLLLLLPLLLLLSASKSLHPAVVGHLSHSHAAKTIFPWLLGSPTSCPLFAVF